MKTLLLILSVFSIANLALSVKLPQLLSNKGKDYFPLQYEMKYNFSLPYWKGLQRDGLIYDVHMWVDEEIEASRMDTLNGVDSTINIGDLSLILTPRIDKEICIEASDGPQLTAKLRNSGALPNLNEWKYEGQTTLHDKKVSLYSYIKHEGDILAHYKFYLTAQGDPVRFYMMGQDYFSGSHHDEYIADFDFYKAGPVDPKVFEVPSICKDLARTFKAKDFNGANFGFRSFLPFPHKGDSLYDEFSEKHGRIHSSHADYHSRRHVYHQNKQYIEEQNVLNKAQGKDALQLQLNQFADWSDQEFKASKFGRLPQVKESLEVSKRNNNSNDHGIDYEPLIPYKSLPINFSWKGTPNDGSVKDQAVCGSCWSFGATGAMEAAWYNFTSHQISLSEQQLADCSWDYENNACNGGLTEQAINYVVDVGGITAENSYEYKGNDDFCRPKAIKPIAVYKGYTVVPHDETKIKEAIVSRGPLQIAIDAALNSFRFYQKGVYYDPKCKTGKNDLDHSVMLVGYGTTEAGEDYWLVKNSWSEYWGDEGYIKVSRKHDCGIKQDAVYAHVDKEKARQQNLV